MARPFVSTNMAMTVDGKITSAAREHPHFTSRYDRRMMDHLRAQSDGVIVGAQTLRADDPPLHIRDAQALALRAKAGKAPELWHIVVSRSLDLDGAPGFFKNPCARRVVATVNSAPAAGIQALAGRAEVWQHGQDQIDLPALLDRLHQAGVERLLLEGGADLNWRFLQADLIDELNVTIGPSLLGGERAPTPVDGAGFLMNEQRRLNLLSVERVEDELYLKYSVKRA